jgi:quercetin dioxygenase-like cupin family protein
MNAEHPSGASGRVTIAYVTHGATRAVAGAWRRLAAVAAALVGVAMVLLPYSAASGQSLPPGPVYRYETQFETFDPPSQFDEVQLILDFAPGDWTPEHFNGGPGFITVLDGEITRRHDGVEETYTAGETWTEDAGDVHAAGNTTDAPASTAAIFLLPKGASLTTVQPTASTEPSPPAPSYRFETQFEVLNPPRAYDVVQLILDFAPGTWTPMHIHGGPGFITIIDGDVTRRTPGTDQVFHPGETWVEEGVHAAGNASAASASTAAIFLLPKGARLTTPVPGPAPA